MNHAGYQQWSLENERFEESDWGVRCFVCGCQALVDMVRGVRTVSGALFNAPDYREGTVCPSAKSWGGAQLVRWVTEGDNILIMLLRYI